jgi:DNA-directed RNA polymerase specialized sigma24 family protein
MENLSPQTHHLASVSDEEWEELWRKLRLHTWRRHGWLCEKFGWDLDAIAHQAILDTLEGIRRWPPTDGETGRPRDDVSLLSFLCQIVRSIISHRYDKEKGRLSLESSDLDSGPGPSVNQSHERLLQDISFRYPQLVRPDTTERDVMYRLLAEEMCEVVAGDAEVLEIVKVWCADPTLKPSEIAVHLGLSMEQMRAAQKRLRRLLKKLREG